MSTKKVTCVYMTKNPAQIEVAEIFARLEATHNLTKADVARELLIERGYVGYLITGKRNPSPRTLEQFRELERRLNPAREEGPMSGAAGAELDAIIRKLVNMQRIDRPNFDVAKKVIHSLSPKASSVVKHKSVKLLKKASAAARGGG
jgi:hypothetical protein